jgi:hypothetical protein
VNCFLNCLTHSNETSACFPISGNCDFPLSHSKVDVLCVHMKDKVMGSLISRELLITINWFSRLGVAVPYFGRIVREFEHKFSRYGLIEYDRCHGKIILRI